MTEKLSVEQIRTAIKDPKHLKQWLAETDRKFLIFDTADLIDGLPWPDGVDALLQIIAAYRDQRRTIPSGRTEVQKHQGHNINVALMKDENLEIEEIDRAIRDLIGQATNLDRSWSLENAPL